MKEIFFYMVAVIIWGAMGAIIYFHSLPVPTGLGGVGVGLLYLLYIAVVVMGTLFLFFLSKSNKQFFTFVSVPFLFTTINLLMMMAKHQ